MTMTTAEKSRRYREKDVDGYRKRKREYARTPEERAKRTAYMAAWRVKNREKHNRQARESHARNAHKHIGKRRDYHLKRVHGITREEYDAILMAQGGVCLICGLPERGSRGRSGRRYLAVDHCHKTGKRRGLLCSKCNGNLGWFEKFKAKVEAYLAK